MDCLNFNEPLKSTNKVLLTHSDKVLALQESLNTYRHDSDIFLPDDNFYLKINGPEDINQMANTIFRWLKIKHKSLVFHLDSSQDEPLIFSKSHGHSQATLGWKVLDDPLYAGSLIAHSIIHHLLAGRHRLIMSESYENESITDLGTIYSGLGILVLNGLENRYNSLGAMAKENYVSEFLDFVSDQRIVNTVWQPYVLPSVIESFIDIESTPTKIGFVGRLESKRKSTKIKYTLAASAILTTILLITFYSATRPKYSEADLVEHRYTINILKEQVRYCEKTLEYKKSRWDNSDVFIKRQIDADATRCKSLQNRYNFELNSYNAKTQP